MKSGVEELMPKLLPVEFAGSSEDLDLSEAPRTPQEYLRQVAGCHAAPVGFSPSLSWQQQQVSNFSKVRQSITKNREHWSSKTLDDNVQMPKLTDEEGWKRFCLGECVYVGASSCIIVTQTESALDYKKVGFPPFLSIISRLSQSTVLMVLDILISWFEEREFVPQLGQWLYALLACLEKPLLPEVHSSIRQLARRCAQLRSTLDSEDDEKLPALNLLICLVARYFEQGDLADQQE